MSGAERQEELGRRCAREGWSVRELERRLQPPPRRAARTADPETAAAAERLALALGVQVEISRRRRGGEIRLRFASEEELIRLFRLLAGEKR
ncbi:MAG: hypothetical protein B7Z61_11180 [Acidobacteria bacterium 37-71-11]|nr:MAG: hypothetical protein B7Z61_11180 [Acidobacteria bacterium 37-71-11]